MKRIWTIIGAVLGLIVVVGAGYFGFRSAQEEMPALPEAPNTVEVTTCDVMQTVTAPGTVVNMDGLILHLPITGRVEEILIQPGDLVSTGDALVRFSAGDVALAVAQAELDVANAQETLKKAQQTRAALGYPRTDNLSIERTQMYYDAAEARYQTAQANYSEVAYLASTDSIRLVAMENLLQAKRERDQLAANLTWFTGHTDDLEIAQADAEVAIAQAKLTKAQETLTLLEDMFKVGDTFGATMNSPVSGVVVEIKAHVGDELPTGSEIAMLVNPQALEIRVTILEEDYPYVSAGQQVELYFDAMPNEEVAGIVDRVVPQRISGERPLYYAYISLDRIPEHLVEGMTVDSAIIIAHRQQVLCLPRALVRASSGDAVIVSVWNGLNSEEREIKLGLRGDVYADIVSGLTEGEQVVSK